MRKKRQNSVDVLNIHSNQVTINRRNGIYDGKDKFYLWNRKAERLSHDLATSGLTAMSSVSWLPIHNIQ